ncbi:alpha/beta fold hydrolase [Larkinella insperata]|uniref:Alpha/beta fold hydrolase n=1 Tax=Larkinella insperata TaxID=332158 RepID=A0ABW3QL70_9BACT
MCKSFSIVTGILCGFWLAISCVHQVEAQSKGVKNVVLVHGAFADGSSWSKVIPLLESKGLKVIAVQNPLTSLKDDVAAAKRAIALMDGPVLLVGHSWGGVVVSEAGNDPKVAGLLYVAAFAPDNGQSLTDLAKTFPPAPGNNQVKPDASGFLSLTPKGIHEDFAQDLPETERRIILATQGTWWAKAPGEKISRAAWRTKPSWYIVSQRDRMINPELERKMAKTIRATTIELNASHVPMVSQPAKVATFIIEAARSVNSKEFVSK